MTRLSLVQGELKPDLLNQLLSGPLSSRIAYRRADLCPCAAERSSGNSNPRCPVCSGLGYTWENVTPAQTKAVQLTRNPVAGYEGREKLPPDAVVVGIADEHGVTYPPESITVLPDGTVRWSGDAPADYTLYTVTTASADLRAGVQGVMSHREYQVRGEYDVLDLQMTLDRHLADGVTLNPAWDTGESDRFALLDAWRRHAQKVTRGSDGPSGDSVIYRAMRDLNVTSIEGNQKRRWEAGADYTFHDGKIIWQQGRGPAHGAVYAVQAQVNPEYYVFKALPQLRHQDGHPLPRRIILKSFENFRNRRPAEAVR